MKKSVGLAFGSDKFEPKAAGCTISEFRGVEFAELVFLMILFNRLRASKFPPGPGFPTGETSEKLFGTPKPFC